MMTPRFRKNAIRGLQIVVALGLLALLWRIADGEEALRLLGEATPGWLVAAFGVLSLQTILSAARWRIIARQLGIVLDAKTALREYYVSQIVNQALPGGILGDAHRAVRARAQAGLVASGQAVLLERLAGQIALGALLIVAFSSTLAVPGGLEWPRWLSLGVLLVVVTALGFLMALIVVARETSGRMSRGLVSFGRAAVQAFAPPSVRWSQIGLSLGTALCNVAGFAFAAWAVGSELSVSAALVLVPLILLAMLIPLTIGGWGLREGAAAALFPLVGAAAAEGLAASVGFGLVFLCVALPGLLFVASQRDKPRPDGDQGEQKA
jgi:uncharacterized protein (TIRG00374 family)